MPDTMTLVSSQPPTTSARDPLRVYWRTGDPTRVLAVLKSIGLPVSDGRVLLWPVLLSVAAAEGSDPDRLEMGDPVPGPMAVSTPGDPRLVALGWATVDAERLAASLGKPLAHEAHEDPALGAIGYGIASATLPLVLLEPAAEGRIAAALARLGEGPVALFLDGVTVGTADDATPLARTGTGRIGRLIRPPRAWGPFIVALQP